MSTKDFIVKDGTVIEALPDGRFKIKVVNEEEQEREVVGYLSGKMRRYKIWILLGDRVKVEFSQYDPNNCRITYRYK